MYKIKHFTNIQLEIYENHCQSVTAKCLFNCSLPYSCIPGYRSQLFAGFCSFPLPSLSAEAHCTLQHTLLCKSGVFLCHRSSSTTNHEAWLCSNDINVQGSCVSILIFSTTLNNVALLITYPCKAKCIFLRLRVTMITTIYRSIDQLYFI